MTIFKSWRVLITLSAIAFIFILTPIKTSAQASEGGVNSGFFGLLLQGDMSYGRSAFGMVDGSTSSSLGWGPGSGYSLNAMANLSIFALKIQYSYSTFDTMEWSNSGLDFKTEGDGYYSTLDALVGLKLFTEQGDMGYTHLYGGFRYWRAVRNVDATYVEGIYTGQPSERDLKGNGLIVGYQDLSTFPLGIISLALQSSMWIDYAPVKTINGGELEGQDSYALGFGLNFGIGAALEDLGILVLVGYKFDITTTQYKDAGTKMVAGAGYGSGYISAAIEF